MSELPAPLLALGIHGCGHAADDLPCTVSANPGVGGAKNFCVRFGWAGPYHLYPVMHDRDIADDLNGQLLDRERLQLDPFGNVLGQPVSEVIFSHGRRTKRRPSNEIVVPERAILFHIIRFDVFPVRFLKVPDLRFVPGHILPKSNCGQEKKHCDRFYHLAIIFSGCENSNRDDSNARKSEGLSG